MTSSELNTLKFYVQKMFDHDGDESCLLQHQRREFHKLLHKYTKERKLSFKARGV